MNNITIPYSDNYRLNIIAASLLTIVFIVSSTFASYFLIGMVLPIIILSSSNGLEIDIQNNQYRDYKKLFGKKRGEWKSLEKFTDIVIQSKSGSKSVLGMRLTAELKIKMVIHSVYLMDENHMKKIFLRSLPSYEDAKKFAADIAMESNFPIASFNPISSRTNTKERR